MDASTLSKYVSDLFLAEEMTGEPEPVTKEEKKESSDSDDKIEPAVLEEEKVEYAVSIYDDECVYVSPMLVIHPTHYRSMTLKLSLHDYQ